MLVKKAGIKDDAAFEGPLRQHSLAGSLLLPLDKLEPEPRKRKLVSELVFCGHAAHGSHTPGMATKVFTLEEDFSYVACGMQAALWNS